MNENEKWYGPEELVRVGCHDCAGCSSCCSGMGESIRLDPYDLYMLTSNLSVSFEELLESRIQLGMADGLILPHIKMGETGDGSCSFLNKEGKCSIHTFRPGLCRAFPLGRDYTEGYLRYFLLENVCPARNKTKMKVQKWLEIPQYKEYQKFLTDYHYFIKETQAKIRTENCTIDQIRDINTRILAKLFQKPYGESFFEEFYRRVEMIRN